MSTVERPEQPLNAELPILVTLEGMLTEIKLVQPLNVEELILDTLDGMLTEVRPVHLLNAY